MTEITAAGTISITAAHRHRAGDRIRYAADAFDPRNGLDCEHLESSARPWGAPRQQEKTPRNPPGVAPRHLDDAVPQRMGGEISKSPGTTNFLLTILDGHDKIAQHVGARVEEGRGP
jgi:hypothetical protein